MVDILVRNVVAETARRLKEKAKSAGASLSETAREVLTAYVRPAKGQAWARIDAVRDKIGPVSDDVTPDIRDDRDSR